MFKLIDNREFVYQWDTNVAVSIDDPRVKEAHFCNRTSDCSLVVEVKDGIANVPNIILQQKYDVKVFAYDGKATLFEQTIKVVERTRPADYVYEETEIIRYEDISKRMNALEENLGSTVVEEVNKYMEENPVEVDLSNYYTKEEVDTALANNKEVYRIDFSEAPSGEANAIQATTEMIEFVERYNAKENVYLIIKDSKNAFGYTGWTATIISGLPANLKIRPDFIDLTKITQQSASRYYTYTLKKSSGVWIYYKEKLADINLTTKEYVDEAIANLDIPEAEVDLTNYYTKTEVDTLISNVPSGGLTEEEVQELIDASINSLGIAEEGEY